MSNIEHRMSNDEVKSDFEIQGSMFDIRYSAFV